MLQQRGGNFKTKITGLSKKKGQKEYCVATACCVRACLQTGPQKLKLQCGSMYNCVENGRCTGVWVSVFCEVESRLNLFLWGSKFQN